ncbi:hypothetical protein FOIG_01582 [Fusarium odoratissimum NRRL 54006]|uniref:Uncharacterized protein n=1 Tax=Fusarium odoratissimum (strain NRRL 54006) TaxID=1089451 RepID=X0K4W6_FUSO5|nr:uncharacterized protein FOIG_01582 [Fusarium odoratissimum NRRL 54006]EXM08498.1 hypothetical protein FOIG_01582 [Fusarium odoratissimum NRRL 54006]
MTAQLYPNAEIISRPGSVPLGKNSLNWVTEVSHDIRLLLSTRTLCIYNTTLLNCYSIIRNSWLMLACLVRLSFSPLLWSMRFGLPPFALSTIWQSPSDSDLRGFCPSVWLPLPLCP